MYERHGRGHGGGAGGAGSGDERHRRSGHVAERRFCPHRQRPQRHGLPAAKSRRAARAKSGSALWGNTRPRRPALSGKPARGALFGQLRVRRRRAGGAGPRLLVQGLALRPRERHHRSREPARGRERHPQYGHGPNWLVLVFRAIAGADLRANGVLAAGELRRRPDRLSSARRADGLDGGRAPVRPARLVYV